MRREVAVAIATGIILFAFFIIYRVNRLEVADVALPRREVILPKWKRTGPRSTLLSTSPLLATNKNGMFKASASPRPVKSPLPTVNTGYSPYPVDSVCDMLWNAAATGDERESDELFLSILDDSGRQDDDQTLFSALIRGDWSDVEGLDRYSDSPAAREIALLGRLDQFAKTDVPLESASSVDPVDLDRVDDMSASDPDNAFWPMLKYSILRSQGMSAEELNPYLVLAESARNYRNPVSSFYGEMKGRALGSVRKLYAFSQIYGKAPVLSPASYQVLKSDIGKSLERDQSIARIGKIMTDSQIHGAELGGAEVHGNMLDAVFGAQLQAQGEHRPSMGQQVYEQLRSIITGSGTDSDEWTQYADPKACDEEGLEKVYSSVRGQAFRTTQTTVSNSPSSPTPLPPASDP